MSKEFRHRIYEEIRGMLISEGYPPGVAHGKAYSTRVRDHVKKELDYFLEGILSVVKTKPKSDILLTLLEEQSTENPSPDASFSPGLKKAMINKSIQLGAFCPHCSMAFPKYPGNYNHKCPICGKDVVRTNRLKELCQKEKEMLQ